MAKKRKKVKKHRKTTLRVNRPDKDYNATQLKKGIEVEMEHTRDPKVAKRIAKHHLDESKNYYRDWEKKEKMLFKRKV